MERTMIDFMPYPAIPQGSTDYQRLSGCCQR
jgi:hypothetical protein